MGQNAALPQNTGGCLTMWVSLLLVGTTLLFLLPLLPTLIELRLREDIQPVAVDPANAGNIDYFAESFLDFITPAIADFQAGKTQRLIDQDYSLFRDDTGFDADAAEMLQSIRHRITIGLGSLHLPAEVYFSQEIFSQKNIDCGERSRLRSVLAIGNLHLGGDSQLLRWAHARNISVDSGCLLLGRVSAEAELVLQPRCEFTRLNAQTITVASEPGSPIADSQQPLAPTTEVTMLRERADRSGRVLWEGDLDFPEFGFWRGDLIVRGNALIRVNAQISGSIKVYGDIQIEPGAGIDGTLVCNGDIHIAEQCRLKGPVVSEQQITIDQHTRIGNPDTPTTVTAPSILVVAGVTVHGSLWARNRGKTLAALDDVRTGLHYSQRA